MLRNALFQVHWFVGITVGIVIALVGSTGTILSFEPEILHALNRDARIVVAAPGEPLPPPELLPRLQAADPARRVAALSVWSDTSRAARVTYAPKEAPRESKGTPPQDALPRAAAAEETRPCSRSGRRRPRRGSGLRGHRTGDRHLTLTRVGRRAETSRVTDRGEPPVRRLRARPSGAPARVMPPPGARGSRHSQ